VSLQHSIDVRVGEVDYICVGTKVDTSILDHHSEAPALVWLKGFSKFLPGQRATIDDHVIGPGSSTVLAVGQPPGYLVVTDDPPRAVRVRFEILARYFGLRLSLDASYEFIDVGVVGTQHGEVISLTDRNPGFLEFHLDSGRCSPDSERQDVTPAIAAPDL
jgi:hypothetical protein